MTMAELRNRPAGASEQLYLYLLWAYPAAYRREYGPLMAQLFRDLLRDARRQPGLLWLARLWTRTLIEVAVTAVHEHLVALRSRYMNTKAITASRFSPAAVRGMLISVAIIAAGLLAKAIILEAGGSVALATGVAIIANVAGAVVMETSVRTGGLVLLGTGLLVGAVLMPLLWVADFEAWLRENPINGFMIILTAAWSTQGRPRWPILAVAGLMAAAQLLVAFI